MKLPFTRDQRPGGDVPGDPAGPAGVMDAAAFQRAVDEHGRNVYRYLYSRLGPQHAEDAVAETFTTAWSARQKYDPALASAETWLLGIATTIIRRFRAREQRWLQMCADSAREQSSRSDEPDDEDDAVDRVDSRARGARLAAVLATLPSREREPLLLHAAYELSYEQIAEALGIPIGTVRSRISRARARLQHAVTDSEVAG